MRKFINCLALAALLFVPWVANAQSYQSIPYTTGFEGLSTGSQPDGWTAIQTGANGSTTFPCAYNYSGNTHNGSVYYEFESGSSSSNVEIAALPLMQNISSLKLTMWVSASSSYPCSLEAGVMEDSVFVPVDTLDLITFTGGSAWASNYHEYTVYYANYTGSGERMALRATRTGSGQFTLFIDDISVSEDNGCYPLSNLHTTAITSSSITLAWTDDMNSGITYTVSYWTANGDTTDITGVTDTTYTVTGLDANTTYTFSVMPNCTTGDGLPVSGAFKTDCANGSCEISVHSYASYSYSYYAPTLNIYQGGSELASINNTTELVSVCSGDTVYVIYEEPYYSWATPYATILDGGGTALFDGETSSYGDNDTLLVIAVPCPSCLPPTALTLDSADQTSLAFHWTPRSSASQFVVYLDGELVDGNVTDTFYTFTSLSANTAYVLGVQSVCTSDDSSSVMTLTARTACGDIVLPFNDNFDSYPNGEWPPCWHRLKAHGTDPSVNAQYHSSGTQSMFLLAQNDTNLFCTPSAIPTTGDNIYVRYKAYVDYSSYSTPDPWWIKVGVMTDTSDVSTFVMLDSIGYHNCNYAFEEHEFNTSTLDPTATYWVAWMFTSSNSYRRGAIDDVYIDEIPSCLRVTGTSVDSITAHTANLSWDNMGADSYNVYYGTTNDINAASTLMVNVTDTAVTLTGLSSETQYYAWIASVCSGNESESNTFNNFTTLISCPAVTNLHVDTTTADGATVSWNPGGTETGWTIAIDSDDYVIVTDTFYTFTGLDAMTGHTVYVRPICDAEDTGAARNTTFATRCADATCYVTVNGTDSYGDGWNGNYINIYQAGIEVGSVTISSGNSVTGTVEVCSTAPVEVRFTQGSWASEMGGTVTDGGGNTVFTISGMGDRSNGDLLATIASPCPECIMPMNLSVDATSITADGVTITWNAGEGSSWIVLLDSTYVNVTDTFYTFSGLNARTTYTAYVATDCSGDTSAFNSITFTTDCATGSCNITVSATSGYTYGTYYSPTVEVYQNNELVASVTEATESVNVCTGIPVNFIYGEPSYSSSYYPPMVTITDGGDAELFSGNTSSMEDGDTLATTPNACPSCMTPDSVMATLIDSNDLTFSWHVIDSVYAYEVSFNGGAWENLGTGIYNAFGLTPNTSYTFSVRAICVPGDTSNTRTISVKTACGQMLLPFVESFENDANGTVPSCWTVVLPGYGNDPAISNENGNTGNNSIRMTTNSGSSMIASSAIPLNGDSIYVSFWADMSDYNPGTLEAGVMTSLTNDSTFIPLLTLTGNSGYTLYEFNTATLSAYYDSTFYLAFRHTSTSTYYNIFIDDINIRLNEGCMYPANVVATPAAHSIDLTWSNSSAYADFAIAYQAAGETAWTLDGTTIDTTYTIDSLLAATQYQVRVGFICATDTLWTTITTQTTCDLLPLPYFENFDAYANDVMPPCWEWSSTFATHWDGGVFLKAYHGGGSEYVVVPQLEGTITKYQVEFDCKVGTPAENDGILFGVTDATGTLLAWLDTIVDANHSRNAHVHHILNMLNYSLPAGSARIAFAQLRSWNEWACLDNINITSLPDCYPVDSLAAHNLIDPDHTSFTWASLGEEAEWQVYVDTVTVSIDSIPDSLLVPVYTRSYEIPMGTIQGGGIYTFYVRANCGVDQSNWNSYTFGAGTVIMNNSATADTVVACGLVVYDNGGPIAGYLPNSNSALVIRAENAGSELQLFGAKFGIGASGATLNVYDGVGTSGTPIYTYNTTNGRDTILDTNLATSTTGALTITFVASGTMCHTGYELYIHCIGTALCERPTQLNAVMTEIGEADVTWNGSSAAYDLYYKPTGATNWTIQSTTADSLHLTGLIADTTYDMQVVGICGNDTSTPSFPIVLNTHYNVVITPCDPISNLTVSDVTNTSATLSWTSNGSAWEIEVVRIGLTDTISATTNPYTLTGLLPNMNYTVRVRTACSGVHVDPYSEWSATETFTTPLNGPTTYTLTVVANNDDWGTVTGSGTYVEGTIAPLTATANEGYYFDRWSDGDTNAVRGVTVTGDATYTAYFLEVGTHDTYYTITVNANNDSWGYVRGGGVFPENSTTTIEAHAYSGYHFVDWNDGNTDSVRTITVIEHMTYTANFAANTGIDDVENYSLSLYPNPASSTVTVSLDGFEGAVAVELVDISGRTVASYTSGESTLTINVSSLTQGAYFVRVTGDKATAVRRLIVR